jgi:transposase
MKAWLETQLSQVPPRGSVAEAIRYALTRWGALCCFLGDGRLELDTNTVERAIRPVALGRKNHLFAGSDGGAARWATVCSLITTALCRARHKQVYAARRTIPNGRVFPRIHGDRHVIGSA